LWETETIDYCRKNNIVVEAYSPLARNDPKLMDAPLMKSLASKYGKTVAQIAIRWSVQNNFVSIPKSKTEKFIKDNLEVFDFELTAEEMEQVKALNCNFHTCWNPHDIKY
jgi:diketogulonate reductase-like aldo/keto reductase